MRRVDTLMVVALSAAIVLILALNSWVIYLDAQARNRPQVYSCAEQSPGHVICTHVAGGQTRG
jgi:hypothetical protein